MTDLSLPSVLLEVVHDDESNQFIGSAYNRESGNDAKIARCMAKTPAGAFVAAAAAAVERVQRRAAMAAIVDAMGRIGKGFEADPEDADAPSAA
jgi:hypothetical protein